MAFQDMPFSLERQHESEALVMPRVWIPVTNADLLASLGKESMDLAAEVLKCKISEEAFKSRKGGASGSDLAGFPGDRRLSPPFLQGATVVHT